ncbi:PPOX class F420-dependent oxidoreductase [Parafrigoribacterium soli]|uniref:PPOX class F420-dependent oxidoreductase n=1 Tax=Parafrigoribacterium soli TaxID=3144663 RepID=UPI0032EEFF73
MAQATTLLDLGDEHFVSLTTFRKSGVGVSTPVWIARDGDALLVTTPQGSGKVKRIRNNDRVELRPSSRMGKVADDAPVAVGHAEILEETPELENVFRKKFGLEYSFFLWIEKFSKQGTKPRYILRITQ